jgi:peptidoglycan hydrolase-like protein with peptidoglycan-binding domain
MTRAGRRRTGRVIVVALVGLAIAGAAAAAAGVGLSKDGAAGNQNDDLPPATAKVTRQTLVDTQTESGDLSYGDTTKVLAKAGGTVTGLAAEGTVVKRGQVLYRIDNKPTVLLYGSLPAYRALSSGTEGPDVKQFEKNLYALGYRGFTVDETFSDKTAEAVEEWQDDLGLDETGTVDLGRVTYANGQARIDTHEADIGASIQPGGAILSYTGTSRVVVVELEVADQRLAKKGSGVKVTVPSGTVVNGKIIGTRTVIDTSDTSGGDPETKIEVTIAISDAKAVVGLDEASVKVGFTAAQRKNVLTVPIAALLALAEGGYGVQVVDGTSTRIVTVDTGLFAGGRVEVSGSGLTAGMTVGVPA